MCGIDNYDIFISHAGEDAFYAVQLEKLLKALGYTVFLDSKKIIPGDSWPETVQRALQGSMLTLILISNRTDSAYYQKAEALMAIQLSRESLSKVVPIFLTKIVILFYSISFKQSSGRNAHY